MNDAIEDYKTLRSALNASKAWAALIGSEYSGGGGGVGYLHSVSVIDPTIYHQRYNGAKNYHVAPEALLGYLGKAIAANFSLILENAIAAQEADMRKAATLARDAYEQVLADAGIPAEPQR